MRAGVLVRHRDVMSVADYTGDPFTLVVARLRERGCSVRTLGDDRARATCPNHRDQRPSLAITRAEDRALLKCFAGCRTGAIVEALGLRIADLFRVGAERHTSSAGVVATYDYVATDGAALQKVRYADKRFRWRTIDPAARSGYRWNMDGHVPRLYREADLGGATRVFVVEGEKAVDRLRAIGLVATCGHAGAGTWRPDWSTRLHAAGCRELIVLADNDAPGRRHAEAVAGSWFGRPDARTKIVELPDLPPNGDVVDFLDSEHPREDDLLAEVERAFAWTPTATAERRRERRLSLQRSRMGRLRVRRRGHAGSALVAANDPIAAALEAIVAILPSLSRPSFRGVWSALKGSHSRLSIERALLRGVEVGVLDADGGETRGRAKFYALRSVTEPGQSSALHSVTASGHFDAEAWPAGTLEPMNPTNGTGVSRCPVTLCAVTPRVRSSETLQEPGCRKGARMSVTDCRDTQVEGRETRATASVAADEGCCGRAGDEWRGRAFVLACRLCPHSPTYYARRAEGQVAAAERP
jgi:hypothetical protein